MHFFMVKAKEWGCWSQQTQIDPLPVVMIILLMHLMRIIFFSHPLWNSAKETQGGPFSLQYPAETWIIHHCFFFNWGHCVFSYSCKKNAERSLVRFPHLHPVVTFCKTSALAGAERWRQHHPLVRVSPHLFLCARTCVSGILNRMLLFYNHT